MESAAPGGTLAGGRVELANEGPAMSLFLPHRGWLVKLARGCTVNDPPLGGSYVKHVLAIFGGPFLEVLLAPAARVGPLRGEPLVLALREVWFFGSSDPVPLPEAPTGREEARGDQRTLIYTTQN